MGWRHGMQARVHTFAPEVRALPGELLGCLKEACLD